MAELLLTAPKNRPMCPPYDLEIVEQKMELGSLVLDCLPIGTNASRAPVGTCSLVYLSSTLHL